MVYRQILVSDQPALQGICWVRLRFLRFRGLVEKISVPGLRLSNALKSLLSIFCSQHTQFRNRTWAFFQVSWHFRISPLMNSISGKGFLCLVKLLNRSLLRELAYCVSRVMYSIPTLLCILKQVATNKLALPSPDPKSQKTEFGFFKFREYEKTFRYSSKFKSSPYTNCGALNPEDN